jgi:thiol-disulfide isomerase/thioredoxin
MSLLQPGDIFPELTLTVPGGKTVTVPETFAGQFGVVLFFRGAWCPYCNGQLRAFQRASATLADVGVRVVALSVDDEATTVGLIAKHGLTFPGRVRRRRAGDRRPHWRLRQPGPGVPAVHRLRPRPGGQDRGERLLQRGHRPAGSRRRRRASALRARARRDFGVIP